MIFDKVAELYGQRNDSASTVALNPLFRCPGDGKCERFTGVGEADWTFDQKVEEACTGCPNKCRPPINPETLSEIAEEVNLSDAEINYHLDKVENLVDDFQCGCKMAEDDHEIWLWDCYKYWIKLQSYYERIIRIKLGFIYDGLAENSKK